MDLYSRIRLIKEVKGLVGLGEPGALDHGQELVLVEDPAIDLLGLFLIAEGAVGAHGPLPDVVLHVRVLGEVEVGRGKIGEDIDDIVAADRLVEVGEYEQVAAQAGAHGLELGVDLGAILAVAHLEDGLDVVEHVAGEAGAELIVGLVGGIEVDGEEAAGGGELVAVGGRLGLVAQDGDGEELGVGLAAGDEEDDEEDEGGDGGGDADEALVEVQHDGRPERATDAAQDATMRVCMRLWVK